MKQLAKQTKSTVRSQNNVNKTCCRSLIGPNAQGWKGSGQNCVSSWRQGSEGRAGLEMSFEEQRKREAPRPHSEPEAQPCCSLSSCPCPRAARRGAHTPPRGDGTQEPTDGTGAWQKFEDKSFTQLCMG